MASVGFDGIEMKQIRTYRADLDGDGIEMKQIRTYRADLDGDKRRAYDIDIPQPEEPMMVAEPDATEKPKTLPRHPAGHFFVMSENHFALFGDKPYKFVTYPNLERAREVAAKMSTRCRVSFFVMESVPSGLIIGDSFVDAGVYNLDRVG